MRDLFDAVKLGAALVVVIVLVILEYGLEFLSDVFSDCAQYINRLGSRFINAVNIPNAAPPPPIKEL